jgi:hypothetical protein
MRVICAVLFIALSGIHEGIAEPLKTFNFRPLTTWEKIKLGAAYYTDPRQIQDTQFAYKYDASSFITDDQKTELNKQALKGNVSCAKFDSNQKSIEPIPCDRLPSPLDPKDAYKVISTEPVLLGKQPETVGTLERSSPLK